MSKMREGFTGLWRRPDFLKLWAGQTTSEFGSQMTVLALPLVAAIILQASPTQMGVLVALETVPVLLLGLAAGVWVDRLRRRPLLITADLGRALLLISIPVFSWLGALRIEILYVVAFGVGVFDVFFDVAYQAFLPVLIPREQLVDGNSKLATSRAVASVSGPSLAGALTQLVTAPFVIILDALSYLVSALFLNSIHAPEFSTTEQEKQIHFWNELKVGLKVVIGSPVLRAIAGCTGTAQLFGNVLKAVMILYVIRELDAEPWLLGLIFASANAGSLLGAILAGRIAKQYGLGATLIGASILAAAGTLFIPMARGPIILAVPLLMIAQFLVRLGATIYSITQLSLRQAITPNHLLGRMNATMRFFALGTIPIGALLGGLLGEVLGLWPTLVVGAIGGLLPTLWIWFSPIRTSSNQQLSSIIR